MLKLSVNNLQFTWCRTAAMLVPRTKSLDEQGSKQCPLIKNSTNEFVFM